MGVWRQHIGLFQYLVSEPMKISGIYSALWEHRGKRGKFCLDSRKGFKEKVLQMNHLDFSQVEREKGMQSRGT